MEQQLRRRRHRPAFSVQMGLWTSTLRSRRSWRSSDLEPGTVLLALRLPWCALDSDTQSISLLVLAGGESLTVRVQEHTRISLPSALHHTLYKIDPASTAPRESTKLGEQLLGSLEGVEHEPGQQPPGDRDSGPMDDDSELPFQDPHF
eukprot:m.686728 g.686728  ORF g.686728 m.686728 type:complete len:148 (+) comp58626_c0_seq75:796-1239(+)